MFYIYLRPQNDVLTNNVLHLFETFNSFGGKQ